MFDTIPNFCPLCGYTLETNYKITRAYCSSCINANKYGFNCGICEFFIQFSPAIYVRYGVEKGLAIYFKNKPTAIQLPTYELDYGNIIDFLQKKIETIQLLG